MQPRIYVCLLCRASNIKHGKSLGIPYLGDRIVAIFGKFVGIYVFTEEKRCTKIMELIILVT
jgi:hypothetical protein